MSDFKISKSDFKLLSQIVMMKETTLVKGLTKILQNYFPIQNVIATDDFIYALGDEPIGLVAHLDTVHRETVQDIFHDSNKKVIWSPQGIGGDDRAGVFAILKILEQGYRPSVIFCTKEETGGIGATEFVKMFIKPLVKTNFLIELDRRGEEDSVFYDLDNEKFEDYINTFGFKTNWGTFSDISVIAPVWQIPAVNLSIGYFNEHSFSEYIHYPSLFKTIERVTKILDYEYIEDHIFEYIENPYSYYWKQMNVTAGTGECKCDYCDKIFPKEEIFGIAEGDATLHLCVDCLQLLFSNNKEITS